MTAPTVSAVMPCYNGIGYIERSLPPLLALLARGEVLEVIVADDGSTDGSAEWAAEHGATVLRVGDRDGPGSARNAASAQARGEIVWFVDADVVVHEDAIVPLRGAFEEPDVVAVFGSYDDEPPYEAFASQYMNLRHHYVHHAHGGEASTFWSGCGAVRRDAFLAVGGFDAERYDRPSIEDIELGYRLRGAGGRIMMDPAMQGTHLKEWSLWGVVHTDIVCRALPWSRLLLETPEAPMALNAGPKEQAKAVLAGLWLLSGVAALVSSWPWAVFLGLSVVVAAAHGDLFDLFRKRRGWLFAIAALGFHQFHLLYSGAAFVWAWVRYQLEGRPRAGSGGHAR